jgi:crotonobetainyl-CoA:carnitine CoA-transferase CaiB-like acyl-CoA transferase
MRIVDVTSSISGPWCSQILGALGAQVIKVEHPLRGDDTRSWGPPFWEGESTAFLAVNANKLSIGLDLKHELGREAILRMVERADVFLQNLRPRRAQSLGLGFESLLERNSRLVYCAIGAFGEPGPLSERPGYDPLMQAAGGIMSLTGEPGGRPLRSGVSIVDQGAGLWAAIGILAALRERDRGRGAQLVDTSLFETALNWVPYQLLGWLAGGGLPHAEGSGMGLIAPYEAFATADGWIMVAAGNDRLFEALCEALQCTELARDARFATNAARVEHRGELSSVLGERLRVHATQHWLGRLVHAGVPAAPVQDIAQVATDAQTAALQMLQPLVHPRIPDLLMVALPLSVNRARIAHRSPAPLLGQSSREVLAWAGYREGEIEELIDTGVVRCAAEPAPGERERSQIADRPPQGRVCHRPQGREKRSER